MITIFADAKMVLYRAVLHVRAVNRLVELALPVVDIIGDRHQWLLWRSLFDDCSCMLVILCPCDEDYIEKDGCFTITFHAIVLKFFYSDLSYIFVSDESHSYVTILAL